MASAFHKIGGWFGGGGGSDDSDSGSGGGWLNKILSLGSLGMGLYGNYAAQNRQNQAIDSTLALQKALANMTPADFSKGVAQMKLPLSLGLRQGVGNMVQANMAERGLAQAPGIFASAMAQALAPFEQKSQEDAIQAFLGMKGLPLGLNPAGVIGATRPNPIDLSGTIQKIQSVFGSKSTTNPEVAGTITNYSDFLNPGGLPITGGGWTGSFGR